MTLIRQINDLVAGCSKNESIAGGLRSSVPKQRPKSFPEDYFYMTELTNPIEAYYLRKNPDFRTPEKLGRKLARGTQLHTLASYWFRDLPNFLVDEGTVDGAQVNIEGVRGRIDYLIGENIFEIKTKDKNPYSSEEVVKFFINDLEQLVFYAAIHPQRPLINYLVFMENVYPFKISTFKITISNLGKIQEQLKSRITLFRQSIENSDPSLLGKCRYFDLECRFSGSGLCSCEQLKPLDSAPIIESIKIEPDKTLTTHLESCRAGAINEPLNCYTTYDVLLPRKYFLRVVRGFEPMYESDPRKEEYKTCLGDTINSFKKQSGADLSPEENTQVKSRKKNPRVRIGHRWLKIKKSGHEEDVILPYIIKVNNTPLAKYAQKPSEYSVAEMGVVCGLYGIDSGLICTVYPELHNHVQVFEVRFQNHKAIFDIVEKTISLLKESQKNNDFAILPICPDYFNEKGKCPLFKECNPDTSS